MAEAQAELVKSQYNLDHTTVRAPAGGTVVNVVLRPGAFIRLKAPVMDFVSSEELWVSVGDLRDGPRPAHTGRGPDVFRLLRELEIRSESWLNYIYNPF
jgi:hypothetical protein